MSERILVLANNSDGLYGFRKELLEAMTHKGELFAAIPDNGWFKELKSIGCQVIETPVDRRGINPVTDIRLFFRYLRLIQKLKPSKVITYTIKPNIYGSIACRLCNVPYAVNITGLGTTFQKEGLLRIFVSVLYKIALHKAYVVFFENSGNMQYMVDERIVQEKQCCVLNGAGVNIEKFQYMDYPKENEKIRFLFIGRIMAEKGINELLSATKQLVDEGYPCELHLLGYYEEDYIEIIEKYSQAGWLHYHGFQTDVRPYIADSHCFVLPSWHEGMANTNLEAASCGRPIITSNIHGCKEAVEDGVSGFVCEVQNENSLISVMKKFMKLQYIEKLQMGWAGRERMKGMFDKKHVVIETMNQVFGDKMI